MMKKNEHGLTYYRDNIRHLVCIPYSIDNLHRMADDLGIGRHFFHKNHYDIPAKRVNDPRIIENSTLIRPREILQIVKSL